MSEKITDHFKVGDKVRWVKVRYISPDYFVNHYEGVIKEIVDTTAMIESVAFTDGLEPVSLFELEVISDEKAK